jgi:putative lipoic acid-binding regulatory protein
MSQDGLTDTELMQFPCQFPLKVFGLNNENFEQIVLELIRVHCPQSTEFEVSKNESKKGKYQSLTITFTAHSRQQLDDIYQSMADCEQVVMSL